MAIVNIYVRGGVIQGVAIPHGSGVVVRVVDYDCESGDCTDTDDDGNPCHVAIYEAPDKNQEVK